MAWAGPGLHAEPSGLASLRPLRARIDRIELTPRRFALLALLALLALTAIVVTGAAVRLSGSGLGCPDSLDDAGGAPPAPGWLLPLFLATFFFPLPRSSLDIVKGT